MRSLSLFKKQLHSTPASLHIVLELAFICRSNAFGNERSHLLLLRVERHIEQLPTPLVLGKQPEPLDWHEFARVNAVEDHLNVASAAVFLGFFGVMETQVILDEYTRCSELLVELLEELEI